MFTSQAQLERKTGKYGTPRFNYLQSLVTEFQQSTNEEAKLQILANLANFAYDPINYEAMRQLNIIELFIDMLTEENPTLIEFAISGLCNCCLDRKNATMIIELGGLPDIVKCLASKNADTVQAAITTLIYLLYSAPDARSSIMTAETIELLQRYAASSNIKVKNVALVFLAHRDATKQTMLESGGSIEFIAKGPAMHIAPNAQSTSSIVLSTTTSPHCGKS